MPSVEVPREIHEAVESYAERRGLSTRQAYADILEYGLNELDSDDEDEDEDLRSGIA